MANCLRQHMLAMPLPYRIDPDCDYVDGLTLRQVDKSCARARLQHFGTHLSEAVAMMVSVN